MSPDEIQADAQLHIMTQADNRMMFQRSPSDTSRSIYETAQISADFLIGIGTLTRQPDLNTIFDPTFHE
jgi:hypothetical protein